MSASQQDDGLAGERQLCRQHLRLERGDERLPVVDGRASLQLALLHARAGEREPV